MEASKRSIKVCRAGKDQHEDQQETKVQMHRCPLSVLQPNALLPVGCASVGPCSDSSRSLSTIFCSHPYSQSSSCRSPPSLPVPPYLSSFHHASQTSIHPQAQPRCPPILEPSEHPLKLLTTLFFGWDLSPFKRKVFTQSPLSNV